MSLKTILKNFLNHVDTLEAQRKVGSDLYEVDFQKLKALTEQLKHDKDYGTKEGLKDVNRRKNRYKDILPYDYTRVVLSDYPGVPGSDYINANYIKGASGSLAYIASQGPLPNTVVDFWRMIWECEVQVIVMACNEQESGKYKCECYWPGDEERKQYGNINVEMVKWRQVCPDFLVRTLKACYEDEKRVLCQFHYTTWPDHGVPNSVQPILELVQLIRDCQPSEAVPVLIHCSAGCGRTGTICAIDYVWGLMRMGKLTKNFNLFNVISDMRRQRIAMVQTKEQYVLVHKAVSSLFEQQLRVIDNHTYENLDEDGEPLILKELPPEESLYEDILDPQMFDKSSRAIDNPFENERPPNRHEYNSVDTTETDCMQLVPKYEILEKSPSAGRKHTNLNLSKMFPNKEHDPSGVIDLNLIAQHAGIVSESVGGDSDNKKDCSAIPSARNSATLLKLRREESVKRLISGWDKASQNLEAPKVVTKANQHEKTESSTLGSFEKNESLESEDHHKVTKTKESKTDSSIEKYVLALCKSSEIGRGLEVSSESKQHRKPEVSPSRDAGAETESVGKRSSDGESQHSGKLVGKATVIRRPSIAKLKALFEKSPASDYEHSSEDSSRRRRPLFRSHSHYVGHSRTFSVPDSSQPLSTSNATSLMTANNIQHSSGGDLVNTSQSLNPSQAQSHAASATEHNLQNNAARRAPSPDKLTYRNYNDVFTNKDMSLPQNELYLKIEQEATMADCGNSYSNTVESDTYLSHETEKDSTSFPFSYENCAFSGEKVLNKKEFSLSRDKDSQSHAPVHLRIKQYITCSFQEKPPNLPMKKRGNTKESTTVVNTIFPCDSSSQFASTNSMVDENNKQKLVASKSEDYLTSPKTVFQLDNHQIVPEARQEIPCDEKLNVKRCLSSGLPEPIIVSSSKDVQHKNSKLKDTNIHSAKKDTSLKVDDSSMSFSESAKERFDKLDDSNIRSNLAGKISHNINSNALKEAKYISMPFQKNLQQLEDKLKKFDNTQKIYEQRFFFLSTNQPIKLQKPMETKELKSPERQSASSSSSKVCENQSTVNSKNKKLNNLLNQDINSKNLLLHSPPPKSKRSHAAKTSSNSQPSQMESELLVKSSDHSEKENSSSLNSDPQKTPVHPNVTKSSDLDKRPRVLPLNTTAPASRSDPRYFPVNRQTAEDARYASERHKAIEIKKKATAQKYESPHNIYAYVSSIASDVKSTAPNPSHSKPLITDTKDLQVDAQRPTHSYMKYTANTCEPLPPNEEIYGVHRPVSAYVSAPLSSESGVTYKEPNGKLHPQSLYTSMYPQRPQNVPPPPLPSSSCTLQHTAANAYPLGPPKPPRTFNHKYKPPFNEPESFGQPEKSKSSSLGQEGGRYIVSVASPKQTESKEHETNVRQPSIYQYIPKVPNRPDRPYEGQHPSQIYGVSQNEFMSYPVSNYSTSSSATQVPEGQYTEATLIRSVCGPSADHTYSTLREKPSLKNEPLYAAIKSKNRHSDYENMYDIPRKHADIMPSNARQGMEPYYHQTYNADPTHSLQYSQSDVGLYAVLQNPSPEQQLPYEIENMESDMNNVPKRVYFDTLQRRHKQQVSWEQRRSHDDMDIRPAPSARLKEQIHARRSMVELDNLEISVASDNGFYDQLAPHRTLHRQDFSQDSSNCNGRSSHKRTPIELSDSLLSKEVHPHKNHTHSKENASFSGTLYKAFGKLTSLTKFSKEPSRNAVEDSRTKASCNEPKEEKKHVNFPHWSPRKASEPQQEPSEQWTEV